MEQEGLAEGELAALVLGVLALAQVVVFFALWGAVQRREAVNVEVRAPGRGLRAVAGDARAVCRHATTIDLSRNELGLGDEGALHERMGEWRCVRNLWLGHNELRALPPVVSCWGNSLRVLWLFHNRLAALPPAVGAWRLLRHLDLSHNALEALPPALGLCRSLQVLRLSHNRLCVLPEELGQCRELAQLLADHNCLAALPDSLGRCARLAVLDVDANALTELPPALARCPLEELSLAGNRISALPPELSLRCPLRELRAAHNALAALPYPLAVRLHRGEMDAAHVDGNEGLFDAAGSAAAGVRLDELLLADLCCTSLADLSEAGPAGVPLLGVRGSGSGNGYGNDDDDGAPAATGPRHLAADLWRARHTYCGYCRHAFCGRGFVRRAFVEVALRPDLRVPCWVEARCCSLMCARRAAVVE